MPYIALLGVKMVHIGIYWLSKLIAGTCFRRISSLGTNAQFGLYSLDKFLAADSCSWSTCRSGRVRFPKARQPSFGDLAWLGRNCRYPVTSNAMNFS